MSLSHCPVMYWNNQIRFQAVSTPREFLALEYLILVSALGAIAGMLMVWSLFPEGIIVEGVILVRGHFIPTMLKVLPIGIHLCLIVVKTHPVSFH
ncbi:hypothetical protein Tco_0028106 [Tanacetum coccineum]